MRRIVIVSVCVCVVFSSVIHTSAERMSRSDAEQAAHNWLAQSSERLTDNLGTVESVTDFRTFYVANLSPEGYLVVSADDLMEPIIAFSGNGTFIATEDNPLYALLSIDMPERLETAEAIDRFMTQSPSFLRTRSDSDMGNAIEDAIQAKTKWDALTGASLNDLPTGISSVSDVRIAPIIQSSWNQKTAQGQACYNYYCPPGPDGNANNYYCGCVATAMAMLMRHWEYPASANGYTFTYSSMPLNPQTVSPLTTTHRQQIGRLCREAGRAVNMNYGSGGSFADMLIVNNALISTFNYSNAEEMYASSGLSSANRNLVLQSNLSGGYPVLMGIHRSGGGHAVIADGFGYSSSTLYYHVNLGWGGSYNAWYNLPTVDAGSYVYTTVDCFVYNIFSNRTGEIIAGRVTDTSGAAVSNATVTATGGYTTQTDGNGYYGLVVPSAQSYTITADKSGYGSDSTSATVGTTSYNICGNYNGADLTLSQYSFSFKAFALTNNVMLRWTAPVDIAMPTNLVMIRSSTTDYPADTSSGSLVYNGTNTSYNHTSLISGQPYYYTIWVHNGTTYTNPPGD